MHIVCFSFSVVKPSFSLSLLFSLEALCTHVTNPDGKAGTGAGTFPQTSPTFFFFLKMEIASHIVFALLFKKIKKRKRNYLEKDKTQ